MSRVFMLIDFLQKCNLYKGAFCPTGGVKYPPVWQSNLFYTFTAKSELQAVLA